MTICTRLSGTVHKITIPPTSPHFTISPRSFNIVMIIKTVKFLCSYPKMQHFSFISSSNVKASINIQTTKKTIN